MSILIGNSCTRLVRRALSDCNDAMLNDIVAEVASGKVDFETAAGRVGRSRLYSRPASLNG
jgi:hypothetical protein